MGDIKFHVNGFNLHILSFVQLAFLVHEILDSWKYGK